MARAAGSHDIDRVFRGPHLYFGVVSRDKATVSTSVKWELGTFSIVVPGTLLSRIFVIPHCMSGSLGEKGH